MKKVRTLNFATSFVAFDLKVGRYIQHIELMKLSENSSSMSILYLKSSRILAKSHLHVLNLKQKPLDMSKPTFISLGWVNRVCINDPGHITKMPVMPIYDKI